MRYSGRREKDQKENMTQKNNNVLGFFCLLYDGMMGNAIKEITKEW